MEEEPLALPFAARFLPFSLLQNFPRRRNIHEARLLKVREAALLLQTPLIILHAAGHFYMYTCII